MANLLFENILLKLVKSKLTVESNGKFKSLCVRLLAIFDFTIFAEKNTIY